MFREIIGEVGSFLKLNWKRIVWCIRVPLIIYIALIVVSDPVLLSQFPTISAIIPEDFVIRVLDITFYPTIIPLLVNGLVAVQILTVSTRLAFFGVEHADQESLFPFGAREVRYYAYIFMVMIVLIPVAIFLVLVALKSGDLLTILIFSLAYVIVAVLLALSIFLLLAGTAIGVRLSFSESWDWTNGFRGTVVILLLYLSALSGLGSHVLEWFAPSEWMEHTTLESGTSLVLAFVIYWIIYGLFSAAVLCMAGVASGTLFRRICPEQQIAHRLSD